MPATLPLRSTIVVALMTTIAVAQNRIFVPAQFSQIGAAVQAATPGTIIEVLPQAGQYQPFVIDRPVTIVGHGIGNQAPFVLVGSGAIGIDFQLPPGTHATVSRIDVAPAIGATLARGIRIVGGNVTLEDCRITAGPDAQGTAGLAAVDVVDTELRFAFSQLQGSRGVTGLRALRSHIQATKSRFFGGSSPAADGIDLQDSTFHGTDCWLLGGEQFLGGAGMPALRSSGAAQAFLVDCTVRGGMGQPGGIGLVNTTTTAVELLRTTPEGGRDFSTNMPMPGTSGPTLTNGDLLGLRWGQPLYRRGTLQPGQPWSVHVTANPTTFALLAVSFHPTGTSTVWTRQPALLPQDISYAIPVVANAAGYGSFVGSLPNVSALTGIALSMQAVAGTSIPLEVSPLTTVVVR